MALFTDGPISSIEDLTAIDSQLLEVASTEGLDATRKLAAAQEEIQIEVEGLIERWRITQVIVTPALRIYSGVKFSNGSRSGLRPLPL